MKLGFNRAHLTGYAGQHLYLGFIRAAIEFLISRTVIDVGKETYDSNVWRPLDVHGS